MHKSSYCGVNCEKCKAYIATKTNNDILRTEVANEWGLLYNREFKNEDIVCEGCKSETLFMLCAKCDIPVCNKKHGITNCFDCEHFPCERIQQFFDFHKAHDTWHLFE